MMHMTFYWGKSVTILFDAWNIKTWAWYAYTLGMLFLFSMFHKWLSSLQAVFRSTYPLEDTPPESAPYIPFPTVKIGGSQTTKALEALLFGVKVGIGYMLMLALMSYNGGVFMSVVAGLTVGYFLFRSGNDKPAFHDPCCAA